MKLFFDEIDHFHPIFDESVPNHLKQGDALMPMLYTFGQQRALLSLQVFLLFACLDDICVVCLPDRVGPIFMHLQEVLYQCARIQVSLLKTQVWNRGGHFPFLPADARSRCTCGPPGQSLAR